MKKILLYLIFYNFFLFQNAYAYIDPGGIGAIFNLIVAGLAAGLFYVRSSIFTLFSKLKNFYLDFYYFLKFFKKKKEIVFYCENSQYLKYFGNIIEILSLEKIDISILIDEKNSELINNDKIDKFFIKSSFLRNLSLNLINCKILVLTTPDIGNSYVKKSKFCKHFFYIFHSVVSTQMVYNKLAFQYYDSICCNGNYQIQELLNEEQKFNLPKKNLIKSGYPLFDKKNIYLKENFEKNKILIAPSWNPKIPDFYEKYYLKILDDLLKENFSIIFRPHPEYTKRFSKNYNSFKNRYLSNDKISFDQNFSLYKSFDISEILITDWSGIAYEFSYFCKKRVIFNDIPLKKLNDNLISAENIFEYKFRETIGTIHDNKKCIIDTIHKLNDEKIDKLKIDNFFQENFFNLENSSKIITENLKNILKSLKIS